MEAGDIFVHIETLRRLKYRPTGGFVQFSFTEAYEAVGWSVSVNTVAASMASQGLVGRAAKRKRR